MAADLERLSRRSVGPAGMAIDWVAVADMVTFCWSHGSTGMKTPECGGIGKPEDADEAVTKASRKWNKGRVMVGERKRETLDSGKAGAKGVVERWMGSARGAGR